MAEYYVRRENACDCKVTKHDGDVVLAEYIVRLEHKPKPHLTCICPKWSKRSTTFCRHTEMVQEFIKQGEPSPYCVVKE